MSANSAEMAAEANAIGWTEALKSACGDRCGEMGEPACSDVVPGCKPCEACIVETYGPREATAPRCPLTPDLFN